MGLQSLPVPKRAEVVACDFLRVGRSEVSGNCRKKLSSWKKFSTIQKVALGKEGAFGPSQTETKEVSSFIFCWLKM